MNLFDVSGIIKLKISESKQRSSHFRKTQTQIYKREIMCTTVFVPWNSIASIIPESRQA